MARKSWHPDLTKFNEFEEELSKETDRGAAIMACTMVDWMLGRMLQNFMVDSSITRELFKGPTAPLSSLSNKIKISYALGLIGKVEYHDLDLLRRIRNDFAHKFEINFSFDEPKIEKNCNKLIIKEDWLGKEIFGARNIFINNALFLIKCIMFRREGGDGRIEEEGNI